MLEEQVQLVYALVAMAGVIFYQYNSWKASGEKFDLSKFIDTLWAGGLLSVIASAAGLAAAGLSLNVTSLSALATAFFLAAGIDRVQNVVLKRSEPKPGQAVEVKS